MFGLLRDSFLGQALPGRVSHHHLFSCTSYWVVSGPTSFVTTAVVFVFLSVAFFFIVLGSCVASS